MTGFAGRVVLVTGGVRGLGRAICQAFAARGAHVVANYFHSRDEARDLDCELVRASVADRDQVGAMFDEIAQRHGRLDVLVNNAASGALLPLSEVDDSHWQRAFDTNVRGSLWCAQRAAGLMGPGSAIVNVSSIGSDLVISDYASVGTTKAAVESLTRYLAVEFAPRGIRVNTASGGLLDNPVAGMFPDADRLAGRVKEATPLGHRLGTEAELAELVVFLASPNASWITGQTVVADGGLSLGAMLLSPQQVPVDEPGDAIAIVGMGVVTPGATDPDELWRVLSGEHNVFTEPDRFDIGSFYSADGAEDRSYTLKSGFIKGGLEGERGTQWLRHSVQTALDGVGRSRQDRWFAAIGCTADGSQELEEYLVYAGYRNRVPGEEAGLAARYRRGRAAPVEYLPHRIGRNALKGLLPDRTELVMIDTACSSALYAVDLGVKALREGSADMALCGGVFAYSARNLVLFSKFSGLSRSGEVRAFDKDADGVLFSDGAGAVVLKRLDRARADGDKVLGIIESVGLSCDGAGKAICAPNHTGQEIALRRAYRDTDQPDWMVCHATGTQAGDSTEVGALCQALGDGPPILVSSNKSIVGHTGWAAGLVSLVQALSALRRGTVPAQRFLHTPIEALQGSRFRAPTVESPVRGRVGISSFGFGGTNAHLVIGDRPRATERGIDESEIVVTGWAVHLPGMDDEQALAWLRGAGPAPDPGFGEDYPLPGFPEVRLPPATLRTMDRSQIMILRVAARLDPRLRDALSTMADTTGVIVGHTGPTRRAIQYALRCYLSDVKLDGLADEIKAMVPPSNEDAFPGIMPSLIPARLTALAGWRGLNATVDTGFDASLDALRCADRYLRHGDLDAAVVAGISGNTMPEFVEVLGERDTVAEGAFLVVLTRKDTAEAARLPILARIRTELGPSGDRPREKPPLAGLNRTYVGADPLVRLVAMIASGAAGRIGSVEEWGPQVVVSAALPERVVRELVPAPARPARLMPHGHMVVIDADTELPEGELRHVRIVARVGTDDLTPMSRLRVLHDKAYLAAQRWNRTAGSFGVLLLDAVRDGVVHPATGPFTGLVKSLARDGAAYAVITDDPDLDRGIQLLEAEAGRAQDLAVSVHVAGRRLAYALRPAAVSGSRPLPDRGSVVVAAGGARGLTAELLAALPEATIYILSRHAPGDQPPSKPDFIRDHPEWTVAQASAEYEKHLARAGTRKTLERLGERAHHLVCDVTDEQDVTHVVDQILMVHDRVDLLINAAGLHNGGANVPLDRAQQVRDTKLLGYLNLCKAFDGRRPDRWYNIGSLLSVLGWPGEADYCAANDLLLAAASWQRARGVAETTLALPLWSEAGFAAEPLVRDLLQQNGTLTSVSTEDGVAMFLAELAAEGTEPEVTYLGPAERRAEVTWQADPERDGYLAGHRIHGLPTVPAAMLAELGVRQLGGNVVSDIEFHAPVAYLADSPVPYRLAVDQDAIRILSDVVAPDGTVLKRDRLHATMTVHNGSFLDLAVVEQQPVPPMADEVDLSGPFVSVRDGRFEPELGKWVSRFSQFSIPVLLVDAAVQVAAGGIPVRIGRIELRTRLNDVALLAEHGDRIRVWSTGRGGAVAMVSDTVLVHVSGVEVAREGVLT
ncbi:SDR family oxidoreductase [Actinocrispum sp. NPDC049592]|uniref:SDR family oxidoreductase n=1 Tax=Actinocrispum sp. NPDC049592 TaxID=3154835 RepID=UPI00342B8C53